MSPRQCKPWSRAAAVVLCLAAVVLGASVFGELRALEQEQEEDKDEEEEEVQHQAPSQRLSPHEALLEQIRQAQTLQLRCVEPRRASTSPREATDTLVFTGPIQRILERGTAIAYDSDSAESSDCSTGDGW